MYETYPKGGKTTHKMEKHESHQSGWKGDNGSKVRYPNSKPGNAVNTNESKQNMRAAFNNGGGNKQVSASYPGKSGKKFNTDCNH